MHSRRPTATPAVAFVLWAALGAAFSPTLIDLVRHLIDAPWARYAAVFPFLFVRLAVRESTASRPDGPAWIALGLAVELLGSFLGVLRLGRVGLVLAAFGTSRWLGCASWKSLVLLALAVPIPAHLVFATHPALPEVLLSAAGAIVELAGVAVAVGSDQAIVAGKSLGLTRFDGGVPLVVLLGGLAWYRCALVGAPTGAGLARVLGAAALALPLQIGALAIALGALPYASEASVRAGLTHAPWMACALFGIAWAELAARRQPRLRGAASASAPPR